MTVTWIEGMIHRECEVVPYTNKKTGRPDPMLKYTDGRGNRTFVHLSLLVTRSDYLFVNGVKTQAFDFYHDYIKHHQ